MSGKWSRPEVPHKGWTCTDVEDMEEPSEICEMCETQEIRYVHVMTHPKYPGELRCGVICAGQMERDLVGAYRREAELKKRTRRRERDVPLVVTPQQQHRASELLRKWRERKWNAA